MEAGDFIYIPAGVPHQPYNATDPLAASWRVPTRTSRRASF
ncbi:MAG TPA: cupin domain-containing protein [Gaiellales bacterium]|nr:cupin domain-containing protein [Gaiellales bacterium]